MTAPSEERREPLVPLGRRPLLTPELQAQIVRLLTAGSYLNVAAQSVGVGRSTLLGWLARGRRAAALRDEGQEVPPEERLYLDFLDATTRADTAAEVYAATVWRSAMKDDWRAARDFLRARFSDRWAPTQRVAISSEESETRIERAVEEAMLALGVDYEGAPGDVLDLDPDTEEALRTLDDPPAPES